MKTHNITILGVDLLMADSDDSVSVPLIAKDMNDDVYGLTVTHFQEGDLVVDIGAHVGVFSVYLGKLFPWLTIHSYEPFLPNYQMLVHNIEANKVSNVIPHNYAVTSQSNQQVILCSRMVNTGGASIFKVNGIGKGAVDGQCGARTIAFDEIVRDLATDRKINFLKIDCEGGEYDIYYNSKSFNARHIKRVALEFHQAISLEEQDFRPSRLYLDLCREFGFENILSANEIKHGRIEAGNVDIT